jgi:hypothetical protein
MLFDRRAFLKAALMLPAGMRVGSAAARAADGELLYNGIRLGDPWPPPLRSIDNHPVRPPYLDSPPSVIPIDVGRQLFVDDFLIEETTLVRRFHAATYIDRNPVLWPATTQEQSDPMAERTGARRNPSAMPFSDGVFYDARDRLFKMWYMGGFVGKTCYATSEDGVAWRRPSLDVVPGTNVVVKADRDSGTVWIDEDDPDPRQRYKQALNDNSGRPLLLTSADGTHWIERGHAGPAGDRTTFFYNPFRQRWVFSIRDSIGNYRVRRYWETTRFERAQWTKDDPVMWTGADRLDPPRRDYNVPPELYNLDCVAYESVLLGLFTMWRGEDSRREKPNDVCVGFSRDGFHFDRTSRSPLLAVSERAGDWNWANVQSAGGCCLVVGDRLFFYVSGRAGVPGTADPGVCSTGLATLRRDGFASLDPPAAGDVVRRSATLGPNTILTRPVRFSGRYLFVNADVPHGRLRAQIEDVDGRPIERYALDASDAMTGNHVSARIGWREADDLAPLAGRAVRIRFETDGPLYAFWTSRSPRGESGGYVAAGGPGYRSTRDV